MLSLWLAQANMATAATKQRFCQVLLCTQPGEDSPTDITKVSNLPASLARADLESNPASAYRWADLADAELNANHLNVGRYCIRQALATAPGSPAILFRAAGQYIRIEDYQDALAQLVKVIRNPDLRGYYNNAFRLYGGMDLPLGDLLEHALPKTPAVAGAFLGFWLNDHKLEEAGQTWDWMTRNSLTSLDSAGIYVSMLGTAGNWDQAMEVWSKYAPKTDPGYEQTNWVYNSGFEASPIESPFDWKILPSEAAEVSRDNYTGFKGNSSLFVRFIHTPLNSKALAYQTVMLRPGKWELSAEMKTEELTSNQGLVVRVVDAGDPAKLDVSTGTLTGTQEWTDVSARFDVAEKTIFARVEILRPPARDLEIEVRGSAWVDNVKLIPVQESAEGRKF